MNRPGITVNQSSVLAWFLLVGFIVFVTMRGELPKYLGAIGIGTATTGGNSNGQAQAQSGK